MAKPFDATFKQILDDFGPDWAVWLVPHLGLPTGPLEAIDPDLSTVQPTADKVFRLPGGAGLLHIELQSGWDGDLPNRILLYNALLHDRYGGPVHSVAILLRPEAESRAVTGVLTRDGADGEQYLRFVYRVVRLWQMPAAPFLNGGLGIAPLGLLTDEAGPRLAEYVKQFAARVQAELPDPGRQDRLLADTFILLGMRYDNVVLRAAFREVQHMKESSTYQFILNEGREEGITLGLNKGRTEARVETLRLTLTTVLEQKFGSVPPDLNAKIQAATDADKLEQAFRQALSLTAVADLVL